MPTPHGSRGGMAFSADELRVLRRALAAALQPTTPTPEDVQDCLRLAAAVDEASREGGRLRTFLFAELARYRAALPGSAPGYLERLRGALDAGYVPGADDLAALRVLRTEPCGAAEARRRNAMLRRCEHLAELDVRARLEARIPAPSRPRLLALPGGRNGEPKAKPKQPAQPESDPKRKVPTPAEIWPKRRREAPPAPAPAPPPPPPPEDRRATG